MSDYIVTTAGEWRPVVVDLDLSEKLLESLGFTRIEDGVIKSAGYIPSLWIARGEPLAIHQHEVRAIVLLDTPPDVPVCLFCESAREGFGLLERFWRLSADRERAILDGALNEILHPLVKSNFDARRAVIELSGCFGADPAKMFRDGRAWSPKSKPGSDMGSDGR